MKRWCCQGCGTSYPIKPNACGKCSYEIVRSSWKDSGVFVLNVGGYIGESTRSEIDYALAHGKPVAYLEESTHG